MNTSDTFADRPSQAQVLDIGAQVLCVGVLIFASTFSVPVSITIYKSQGALWYGGIYHNYAAARRKEGQPRRFSPTLRGMQYHNLDCSSQGI